MDSKEQSPQNWGLGRSPTLTSGMWGEMEVAVQNSACVNRPWAGWAEAWDAQHQEDRQRPRDCRPLRNRTLLTATLLT